ncbi:odorant-binding protein 1a-like [Acomys russatus]|uniref:odorant-binding protein 1a-like n=1 Tax=Acomys russatus TaxID=60746 RepID=UPI0021E1D5EB|nr:odorant-binding protein 1a-like [Acomys russatus]
MLKFLLLALVFGFAQAKLEGTWYTIAIAADNVEKIEKEGEMRLYDREITCEEDCKKMKVKFFVKQNGQCTETTVVGEMQEDGETYQAQFSGNNYFKPVKHTEEHVVFTVQNIDKEKKETKLIFVLGKNEKLTPEEMEKLVDFAKEKGIPPENIREIVKTDRKMLVPELTVSRRISTTEHQSLLKMIALKEAPCKGYSGWVNVNPPLSKAAFFTLEDPGGGHKPDRDNTRTSRFDVVIPLAGMGLAILVTDLELQHSSLLTILINCKSQNL